MHIIKISFFENVFYKRNFESYRFIFIYRIEEFDIVRILFESFEGIFFEIIDF